MGVRIKSVASYASDNVVTNDDLAKIVDTSDEWISSRSGIKRRHISCDEDTALMAFKAAEKAIEKAEISKAEIDLIIVATFTPNSLMPSTACLVQRYLEISDNVTAFDLNAACSGFAYALKVATALINSGMHKKALIIGSEHISKFLNWEDRGTCVLFGDGAGAMVLESSNINNILSIDTGSIPDIDNVLTLGVTTDEDIAKIEMKGPAVFKYAVNIVVNAIEKILQENDITVDDVAYIIPHQANYRIISSVSKKLKIDEDKFYLNLEEYGNTSAASIPIALAEMLDKNLLKPGDKIIIVGFGAGLTWGSSLIML